MKISTDAGNFFLKQILDSVSFSDEVEDDRGQGHELTFSCCVSVTFIIERSGLQSVLTVIMIGMIIYSVLTVILISMLINSVLTVIMIGIGKTISKQQVVCKDTADVCSLIVSFLCLEQFQCVIILY